jgi:replication-associated recombination protein RarA
MTETEGWADRPIGDYSTDPFVGQQTLHGLETDEVRSALHKHVRQGHLEQSVRAALELARTDAAHEEMMWERLTVIAAEDIGLGDPSAIAIVAALRVSAKSFEVGAYERVEFAAQAAGYLASAPKDPTIGEIMQVVMHEERAPDIPEEAICVHTRRGQLAGKGMYDWFTTGTVIHPEVAGRDTSWHTYLEQLYRRLDPPKA